MQVTERRTAKDFAEVLHWIGGGFHPDAEKVVVRDNLNTPKAASPYEAFPPEQARRIVDRLEIHPTPKHGSWLNRAEIERSVMSGQCLDRPIDKVEEYRPGKATAMNAKSVWTWRFTTADDRIKPLRLYPTTQI